MSTKETNWKKTTELSSFYRRLEKMSLRMLLVNINKEDKKVAWSVQKAIPQIEKLVNVIVKKIKTGGRLFYMGSGTSGRLGIVDASECPPTYGVNHGLVIGLIAGGDTAIRKAVEFAEDSFDQGWKDLKKNKISTKDVVIGISASGTTPYVVGAVEECNRQKVITGCITCNKSSPLACKSKYPIEVVVGPEFVTGSTRMKAGTAQKLVLNMISTSVMIKLGKIKDNKMVDMQLTNSKLINRGTRMIMETFSLSYEDANKLLIKYGNVRKVLNKKRKGNRKK